MVESPYVDIASLVWRRNKKGAKANAIDALSFLLATNVTLVLNVEESHGVFHGGA